MRVVRLDLHNLRRFESAQLLPAPGMNVITGDNGAGKSSVLEALHLMAYGRSFRGRVRDGLVRSGQPALEVFVEWREGSGSADGAGAASSAGMLRRAGLRHTGQQWSGRLDGQSVDQLGELCQALAVVTFEPGSHALVSGSADNRRRFLDWGLFHVEPKFMASWRRYSRALKQRNALLKTRASSAQLDAWDRELAESGEPLSAYREDYLRSVEPVMVELAATLAPSLGRASAAFAPGWRRDEVPLADALLLARPRDVQAGFTSVGPHRSDWRIDFEAVPNRDALSRGQAKLAALTALFSQASHLAVSLGEWPVIALDDLASELDGRHQQRVLGYLEATGAQAFVTGTEVPRSVTHLASPPAVFHVEHGSIQPLA
jgi:DNA replication and repair protein RecF